LVGDGVKVSVGVLVRDGVYVIVGVLVRVGVLDGVGVLDAVGVLDGVYVIVGVLVRDGVNVIVGVLVGVSVGGINRMVSTMRVYCWCGSLSRARMVMVYVAPLTMGWPFGQAYELMGVQTPPVSPLRQKGAVPSVLLYMNAPPLLSYTSKKNCVMVPPGSGSVTSASTVKVGPLTTACMLAVMTGPYRPCRSRPQVKFPTV
jgi:hypothetical protein